MMPQGRSSVWWILVAAAVTVLPYLPSLAAPFDFNDDGCLVYSAPVRSLAGWLQLVTERTYDDFHYRGPFRPVTWIHWTASAELFSDNAFAHRAVRFGWLYLAAGLFLWLLAELGISVWPALFATAIAFWSPFRNEYWLGLGLTEAFGTPYGFFALIASIRAGRSARPWSWDFLGWLSALAAIGCKNTFAAIVPAMIFFRLAATGLPLAIAVRRYWASALLLGSALLCPIAHLVALKLDASPKEYTITGFSWQSAVLWPRALLAGFGFDYLAPALLLLGLALYRAFRLPQTQLPVANGCLVGLSSLIPAILLVCAGVGVYLPMPPGVSGRYTVPAVWGVDLLLAQLFRAGFQLPPTIWKRLGIAALVIGATGMLIANIGKQTKWQGRADLLWQVARAVEEELPESSKLAWIGTAFPKGQELGLGEGVHFQWHLEHRGQKRILIILVDQVDWHGLHGAHFACTAGSEPPPGHWYPVHSFKAYYWLGLRSFACYLWKSP